MRLRGQWIQADLCGGERRKTDQPRNHVRQKHREILFGRIVQFEVDALRQKHDDGRRSEQCPPEDVHMRKMPAAAIRVVTHEQDQ